MDGLLFEAAAGGVMALYTLFLVESLSLIHAKLREKGVPEHLATYLNRKFIHAFTAGVVAVLTPFLFNTPFIPFTLSMLLAAILAYARRKGGMSWFQEKRDANEVTFAVAWGASLLATWLATRNMMLAVLPPLYISIGDAVTGFTRALVAGRRVKHWSGNIAMAAFTVPLGYLLLGPPGILVGVAAALAERIDKPVDDNIAVALVTTLGVVAVKTLCGS